MRAMRKVSPQDIALPPQYQIDVFAQGLTSPICLVFTSAGEMLVADAGITDGNGKVLKLKPSGWQVIAERFTPPLTGINVFKDHIYVSHRGKITIIKPDGHQEDILIGLPSFGDHHNNQVIFGPDGKMYFGQGTATNSGVVGEDNDWMKQHPYFHDYPGDSVSLIGQNFESENLLTSAKGDLASTGAYSPFGVATEPGEVVKGITAASGSILRANPDGTELELIAWGLRNPFRMKFDRYNRLFSTNHGMDERGSRPIANSPDEFHLIQPGAWYGWPDYTGGYPVTHPHFAPKGKPQPSFLLSQHPMHPVRPVAAFEPHSAIMGFDFNKNPAFAPIGDVFLAEFGSGAPTTTGGKPAPRVGHRVSRIDMKTGKITPFAINKSGFAASQTDGGGFERPIDVVFGPTGAMYVVDFGGVIWRIVRK